MKRILFFLLFALLFLVGCGFKAENISFEDTVFTYDGTEKSIISNDTVPENISLVYENNVAVEAGTYTAKLSIYNKKSGDLLAEKVASLIINKAEYDMSSIRLSDKEFVYDGKPHSLSLDGLLPDGVSASFLQNSFVDAGSYPITVSFTGDEKNYNSIPSITATLNILPALPNPTLTLQNEFLHSKSVPSVLSDIEGEVIFQKNQALTPGTNTYYFDFYPKSTNYKTYFSIPMTLTVKATVNYITSTQSFCEYIDFGQKAENIALLPYEKGNILNVFSHWSEYAGGSPFDFDRPIYSDMSLYGVYKAQSKQYVTLHYTKDKSESFGYYAEQLPTILPNVSDSDFLGWFDLPFFSAHRLTHLYSDTIKDLYALYLPKVSLNENEELRASSTYEKEKLFVKASDVYRGSLIEINGVLSSDISPSELTLLYGNVSDVKLSSSTLKADATAIAALEALCADYKKSGGTNYLYVSSAYDDTGIIAPDLKSGFSFKLKCITESGASYELYSPNAADINSFLDLHAAAYGFVKRYTEDNEDSTGIYDTSKSSIYRYVGIPHASFMQNHSLSLEEYICYIKSLENQHLYIKQGDVEYEIYYLPYSPTLLLPKGEEVTVSGTNNDGFIITVKRDLAPRELDILLCLDAGHGGYDVGAGSKEPYESEIALSVVKLLEKECKRQGFSVLLTRNSDIYVGLEERCIIANSAGASSFISIHCNSYKTATPNGTEVFFAYGEKSNLLANKVYSAMIDAVPLTQRGIKTENFVVIKNTNMPAILCELAFISNPSDREKLISEEYQAKWAEAICRGICEYYGLLYLEY